MTSPIERTYAFRLGYRQARQGKPPYGAQFMSALGAMVYAMGQLKGLIERAEAGESCAECFQPLPKADPERHACPMKGGE